MSLKMRPDYFIMVETAYNGDADTVEINLLSDDDGKLVVSGDTWQPNIYSSGFTQKFFYLYELNLISIVLTSTVKDLATRGTYGKIWLCQGSELYYRKLMLLNSGYFTPTYPLEWPITIQNRDQVVKPPIVIHSVTPAVGNPAIYTNPSGVAIDIYSCYFNLTTSAVVANRSPYLIIDKPGYPELSITQVKQVQGASLNWSYSLERGHDQDNRVSTLVYSPLNHVEVGWGGLLTLDWRNADPGDFLSQVDFYVEERIIL